MMRRLSVVLLFAALTIVMAAPWSLHPATRVVVDNPDTHLYIWNIGWVVHALTTDPLGVFDANIFHPLANTLAYSENVIGSAILAAPVVWSTGNLVLALNVVLLAACALCGVGATVLARRVGLSPGAAILAGLVFAFAPTRFYRMSQLHLDTVQWLPFSLAFAHAYLDRGRARDLQLATAFFTLQAITSGHGALMLVVALGTLAAYAIARGAPLTIGRRLKDFGLTGACLLLPAVLVVLPYRRVRADLGLDRSFGDPAVSPESFIASPTLAHQWILSWFTDRDLNATATAFLFPGYLVVALAAIALWPRSGRRATGGGDEPARLRRQVGFYAVLALLSLALFIGGPVNLWHWVRAWPGFDFVRAPSRFAIVMTLALAVLAAAGFDRVMAGRSVRVRAWATAVAAVLLLAEYSTHPFSGVPFAMPTTSVVQHLARLPPPVVVAEVPVPRITREGAFERFQTAAMLHTTPHWGRTIHGYSGLLPPLHERVFQEMLTFPDATSLTSLRVMGVTHVIVHRHEYSAETWPEMERRVRSTAGLQVVHEDADGVLVVLSPGP
jgi:hypothetical protein